MARTKENPKSAYTKAARARHARLSYPSFRISAEKRTRVPIAIFFSREKALSPSPSPSLPPRTFPRLYSAQRAEERRLIASSMTSRAYSGPARTQAQQRRMNLSSAHGIIASLSRSLPPAFLARRHRRRLRRSRCRKCSDSCAFGEPRFSFRFALSRYEMCSNVHACAHRRGKRVARIFPFPIMLALSRSIKKFVTRFSSSAPRGGRRIIARDLRNCTISIRANKARRDKLFRERSALGLAVARLCSKFAGALVDTDERLIFLLPILNDRPME